MKAKKYYYSSEQRAFYNAKNRCTNPNNPKYKNYGSRGIQFKFDSFEDFSRELGDKPEPKHLYSLERIDNNSHYQSGNVKWATSSEQMRNQTVNNWMTHNGKTQCLEDWSKELNLHKETIRSRIYRYGWCIDCALSITPDQRKGKCNHVR